MEYSVTFPGGTTHYLLNKAFSSVEALVKPVDCIIVTDSKVAALYGHLFEHFKGVITIQEGEGHKNFSTLLHIVQQLLHHEAHRGTTVLAVGGGMVTDMAGFAASVYMRGIKVGYAPTTLLGMVDAAIGGKNGLNIGLQKNLLGTISQPDFILFDYHFLQTLPVEEWSNGFAEIIKYACLFDAAMFNELQQNDIIYYRNNHAALAALAGRCTDWKNKMVLADEREKGMRKLLNFGHTAGHAFETLCHIPHGQAVAIGMLVACRLSEEVCGLAAAATQQLAALLKQYNLPVNLHADTEQLMQILTMDKKRDGGGIAFIVLQQIGKGAVHHVSFNTIKKTLEEFKNESNY